MTKIYKSTWFAAFLKDICTFVVFLGRLPYTLNFHVKIQLFVPLKSAQDPEPHGYALTWLSGSGSALR
jgi:hypothetical protein